jgi:hypothetical protein
MVASGVAPIQVSVRNDLIFVTYHSGATDEQYKAYLDAMTRHAFDAAKANHVFGQVHDTSLWTRSTAKQRQMQADWIEQHKDFLGKRCAAVSFVVTSALVRGGLTAVLWMSSFPMPYKVFAALGEAEYWTRAKVESAKRAYGLG